MTSEQSAIPAPLGPEQWKHTASQMNSFYVARFDVYGFTFISKSCSRVMSNDHVQLPVHI